MQSGATHPRDDACLKRKGGRGALHRARWRGRGEGDLGQAGWSTLPTLYSYLCAGHRLGDGGTSRSRSPPPTSCHLGGHGGWAPSGCPRPVPPEAEQGAVGAEGAIEADEGVALLGELVPGQTCRGGGEGADEGEALLGELVPGQSCRGRGEAKTKAASAALRQSTPCPHLMQPSGSPHPVHTLSTPCPHLTQQPSGSPHTR